jgi:cell division protein FtsW
MLACFMVIFIAGCLDRRIIIKILSVTVLVVVISLKFGQRGGTILNRLLSFSHNELPYQVYQSYAAIIRGGILGNGPGNSIQRNFLPHAYSDYIYSIIIEEYGLVCGVVIMIFYITMTYRVIKNIRNRQYDDIFAKILAVALCNFVTLESCVNMSVSVGLLPSTGMQLPFISMGGTSFIFTSIMYGIILNIIQSKH